MPLSITQIKRLKSYSQKKFRRLDGVFVAETPKVVEVLLAGNRQVHEIYALPSWLKREDNSLRVKRCEKAQGHKIAVTEISPKELERISNLDTPHEIFAVLQMPQGLSDMDDSLLEGCTLVLDDIRDPGNLGTILRVADWFGIDHVLCTENCADAYQPKCVQASMGSVGVCDIRYAKREAMAAFATKPRHVYGTFLQGDNLYQTHLAQENAWYIIGNEAHGIGADLESIVHKRLTIPAFPKHSTGAESLNAAIATAILCSEIRR